MFKKLRIFSGNSIHVEMDNVDVSYNKSSLIILKPAPEQRTYFVD